MQIDTVMRKFTFIMMAAMAFLAVHAQQYVPDAFARLAASGESRQERAYQANDSTGRRVALLEVHQFTLSPASQWRFHDVLDAFDSDSTAAYYSRSERPGDKDRRILAVAYGTEGESVQVGKDPDTHCRVMCFADPGREGFRSSYAVEWKEESDGALTGRMISAYGKRPASEKRVFTFGGLEVLDSLDIDSDEVASVLREVGPALKGVIGGIATSGAEVLDELKSHGIDLEGVFDPETLKGIGEVVVGTVQDSDEALTDDVSWLKAFNHYRNALLRAAKRQSGSTATYASSLLKLCKQADKAGLSASEKKMCVKSLKETRKATRDTFVKGLLEEAMLQLR